MSDAGTQQMGRSSLELGALCGPSPHDRNAERDWTTETVAHQMSLPANSLLVGTTIRVVAHGIAEGRSPRVLPRLRIGGAGTTSDTQVCATTAAAITTGTGWAV